MKRVTIALAGCAAAATLVFLALTAPPAVAEGETDGKAVFLSAKCNMCHAVPAAGIEAKTTSEKMKGPDIAGITTDPAELSKFLRKEAQLNGKDHKKAFAGSDEELATLVAWIGQQKGG